MFYWTVVIVFLYIMYSNFKHKFSIIVTCYNLAQFLPDALDSILNQSYSSWECIIVDDGSTDKTQEVAQEYMKKDSRFSYVYQSNCGPSSSRNTGLKHVKGDYIFSLDADDIIEPTYMERVLAVYQANPKLKLVYSKLMFFGAFDGVWEGPDYSFETLKWKNMLPPCAVFKKSDWNKQVWYDETMRGFVDWNFWLSFLSPQDEVYRIDEPLYCYRKHTNNSSVLDKAQSQKKHLMRKIVENHIEYYQSSIGDILYWHSLQDELSDLQMIITTIKQQQNRIYSSKAYRLGKFLLSPFAWLRRKLK